MKISIITPSLNQGEFIEKTIKSILSQDYPFLEYIIIDGGSTDNTHDILRKYNGKIKWISEKDSGPPEAINKGLRMASGDIIGLMNGDDIYEPDCLKAVSGFFNKFPDCQWLTGDYFIIDENDNKIQSFVVLYKRLLRLYPSFDMLCFANFIVYPGTFFRKKIVSETGFFDESLFYANDYDYWLRIIQKYPLYVINKPLSSFRIHKKSIGGHLYEKQFREAFEVVKKYNKNRLLLLMHKLHAGIANMVYHLIK